SITAIAGCSNTATALAFSATGANCVLRRLRDRFDFRTCRGAMVDGASSANQSADTSTAELGANIVGRAGERLGTIMNKPAQRGQRRPVWMAPAGNLPGYLQ